MGTSENFCLRWNDFESNVSGAFRELRAESDFFDVTLACDEANGRTLQAHKVILSACSPFFKQMLRNTTSKYGQHPNPLIYLRGVRLSDLESVLDFMYHGEVNVAQDELNSFLAVAEDLQIKGLTQQSGGKKNPRKSAASTPAAGAPTSSKRMRRDPPPDDDDDVKVVVNVKHEFDHSSAGPSTSSNSKVKSTATAENYVAPSAAVAATGEVYDDDEEEGYEDDDAYGYGDDGGDDSLMEDPGAAGQDSTKEDGEEELMVALIKLAGGRGECGKCGRHFTRVADCRRHLLRSHSTGEYECSSCFVTFSNAYDLQRHAKRAHGHVPPAHLPSSSP